MVENAAELRTKRRANAGGQHQLFRGCFGGSSGDLIDGVDPRPVAAGFAPAPVEPFPRRREPLNDHRYKRLIPLQRLPDDLQGLPEAFLQYPGFIPTPAPLAGAIATRQ
jgi:hypothetical protein